jgi:hypothetical protein
MATDERQAYYSQAIRDLLEEASSKSEPALLLEAISVCLGAMGAVLDDPEHRKSYMDTLVEQVTYRMNQIRAAR